MYVACKERMKCNGYFCLDGCTILQAVGERADCKAGMAFMKALPWCEDQSLMKRKRKKLKTMQLSLLLLM